MLFKKYKERTALVIKTMIVGHKDHEFTIVCFNSRLIHYLIVQYVIVHVISKVAKSPQISRQKYGNFCLLNAQFIKELQILHSLNTPPPRLSFEYNRPLFSIIDLFVLCILICVFFYILSLFVT